MHSSFLAREYVIVAVFDLNPSEADRISHSRKRELGMTRPKTLARSILEFGTSFLAILLIMAAGLGLRALLVMAYVTH